MRGDYSNRAQGVEVGIGGLPRAQSYITALTSGASFELQSLTDAFHGWLHKTHMLQSSTKGQTDDLNTLSGPQLPAIRETFGFPSAGRRFVKVLHDAWSS